MTELTQFDQNEDSGADHNEEYPQVKDHGAGDFKFTDNRPLQICEGGGQEWVRLEHSGQTSDKGSG